MIVADDVEEEEDKSERRIVRVELVLEVGACADGRGGGGTGA